MNEDDSIFSSHSAPPILSQEHGEEQIIIASDEQKLIGYVDLMGVSKWFKSLEKNNNLSQEVEDYFGTYLKAIWKHHRQDVMRISVHPLGDAMIVVPKTTPRDKSKPMDTKEFTKWLSDLWLKLVALGEDYHPKILITKSRYQSIALEKNNGYRPEVDWYKKLVFPGGIATVKLHSADKFLNVPAGIYSDIDDEGLVRGISCESVGQNRKTDEWYVIQFWKYFHNAQHKIILERLKTEAESYKSQRNNEDMGWINTDKILNSMLTENEKT